MANEIHLTPDGHKKLVEELADLKGRVRLKVADAIREAKAHGDLKENAAYHEAKLNQTRLESRIAELEKALQRAKIYDGTGKEDGTVQLGTSVELLDLEYDDKFVVKVVGDFESDPNQDMISINSPLGLSLRDKRVGDEVEVAAPAGTNRYRILSIT